MIIKQSLTLAMRKTFKVFCQRNLKPLEKRWQSPLNEKHGVQRVQFILSPYIENFQFFNQIFKFLMQNYNMPLNTHSVDFSSFLQQSVGSINFNWNTK